MLLEGDPKGTHAELRARNAELEAIFRALPDLLFEIDADGLIVRYRAGRADDLYTSPSEFLGRRMSDVLPAETGRLIDEALARIRAGATVARAEYELVVGGEAKHFDARIVPVEGGSAIVVVRDVTELQRAHDERRRLDRKLQDAQRLESLGLLAGGIGHDLNNLLAAVIGGAELLARAAPEGSPTSEHVEIVRQAAWRAAELSRQLLTYAGKSRLEMQPIDAAELVLDTAQLLGAAVAKGVRLELDVGRTLPAVHADPAQLRQVVMNLITNASDAIDAQGGRVTLRARVAPDDAARANDAAAPAWVEIEVEDDGCGMDASTLGRMFDPFFTTKGPGRGLGLASVLGIVRAHGGRIDVESARDRGTRVRLVLPAIDRPARPLARLRRDTSPSLGAGTVLVADDEPDVRRVVTQLLEAAGLSVVAAPDGVEALAELRRGVSVDLAIVDMTMPRLSGDEVVDELRRIDPQLPVIVMTGYDARDAWHRLSAVDPAATLLEKPFSAAALLDAVRSALPRRVPTPNEAPALDRDDVT